MNKKLLAGGVVIALLAGWVGAGLQPDPVAPAPQLGALSGPDIQSPYLSVGGVRKEYRSSTLSASTTPCALQAPAATSTLVNFGVRLSTASSTATVWTLAKATTAFATTTAFDQFSVGSGALGAFYVGHASSTAPDENGVIAPSNYVVVGVQGTAIADSTKLNGVCQAEFIVL